MPCRVDPTPEEIAASHAISDERLIKPFRDRADQLTRENDTLRELLLRLIDEHEIKLDGDGTAERLLREAQERHRREDLKRLEATLIEIVQNTGRSQAVRVDAAQRLARVMSARPQYPLAGQLGFDPDEL